MLFPGRIYIARGPWYSRDYRNIFQLNTGGDQKKVIPFERGAPGVVPYGKSGPGKSLTFIKKLDPGPDVAAFKTKTLNLTRVIHLNWLAKTALRDPRPYVSQYYC